MVLFGEEPYIKQASMSATCGRENWGKIQQGLIAYHFMC